VDAEHHAGARVADGGARMCGKIVEEARDLSVGIFGGLVLLGGNGADGNKGSGVDRTCVGAVPMMAWTRWTPALFSNRESSSAATSCVVRP
jgi:hypothetical protein